MAELHFFTGTMDSGKSTLALQTNHNHAARGRVGRIFTSNDRAGQAQLSSRLGLTHDALEVTADFESWLARHLDRSGQPHGVACHDQGVQLGELSFTVVTGRHRQFLRAPAA